jgi:hypothetical protein
LRPFRLPTLLPGALSLAILSFGSGVASAGAEPTEAELSQARERFGEARRLEDAGRWKDALAQLLRVAEVKMTPQVRFHIALCRENMGLWTEALDGYAQAATEAKGSAPDVMLEANEHIRKLEGSMPTVTVRVNGAAAADQLLLDQRVLSIDEHPLAIRADPGPHRAEVRRGNAVVARAFLTLEPRTTRRIELTIGAVAEPPPGWTGPDGADPNHPPVGDARPPPPSDRSTQRALGYGALGLTGASAIAMGVFIGLRGSALGRLNAACPTYTRCPRSVEPIVSEGKTYATLVNVFGVLTGVAAAGGVALLITAPRPSGAGKTAPATNFTLSSRVGFGTAGLSVEGAF